MKNPSQQAAALALGLAIGFLIAKGTGGSGSRVRADAGERSPEAALAAVASTNLNGKFREKIPVELEN